MRSDPVAPCELFRFEGRTVLVTGASRGIGQGIALRFAQAGASVIVGYRNDAEGAKRTMTAIETGGGAGCATQVDVCDRAAFARAIDLAVDRFDGLDVLVNNAGAYPLLPLSEMTEAAWSENLDVNLRSVFLGTQLAATRMPVGSAIVNVASIEALHPAPGHSHYASAKAAVLMHTRAAALELGPKGIRVNAVSPGLIDYPELATLWPEGVERYSRAAPLGRIGHRDEVADAVLFLASPAARFITGANLVVDGGVCASPIF